MSNLSSQLRALLPPALNQLVSLTGQLVDSLRQEAKYPIWVWQCRDAIASREQLLEHIAALDFEDLQAASNTKTCTALVGTSPNTLQLIAALNLERQTVTEILRDMDDITLTVEDAQGSHYEKLVKIALTACGHPRLHRKQIMRPFEILDTEPERVGFTWARIRKSERISTEEARLKINNLLERAISESRQSYLEQELRLLNQLDAEEPLSIVTPPHVHPRANIVWAEGEQVIRQTRRAVVPIFYPSLPGQSLPLIKPLAAEPHPAGHRMKRRDVKIMDEPFLPSIRAHRYIKHARNQPLL